jgi:hypothetical protein
MGTSKFMVLVPLFDLKSLGSFRRLRCRDFKSAALVVLDDVTPGYMRARAALKSCEAGLELALQSWTPRRHAV